MTMKTALRSRLLNDPAVAAIVGLRVDWGARRQGDPLPAMRLLVVSDPRPQHLKGFQRLRETRVQVDCYAAEYADAEALATAAITAAVPAGTFHGVRFQRGGADGPRDLGEQTETGFVHRHQVDLLIRHVAA